jgi:hypothetical protein
MQQFKELHKFGYTVYNLLGYSQGAKVSAVPDQKAGVQQVPVQTGPVWNCGQISAKINFHISVHPHDFMVKTCQTRKPSSLPRPSPEVFCREIIFFERVYILLAPTVTLVLSMFA